MDPLGDRGKNSKGGIIMKSCNNWLIGLSVFCVLLVPSIGASQTVEQVTGLAVFDVEGDRVGPVLGMEGSGSGAPLGAWFSLKVNDILVTLATLELENNGRFLIGMLPDNVFFESSDCMGTPLTKNPSPGMWPVRVTVGGPNPGQAGGEVTVSSISQILMREK